jgi:GR25 family glycosyltransferase involved in LPS biosynthesis
MIYKLNTYIITLNKTSNDFLDYNELNPIIIKGVNGNQLNKKKHTINFSYFNNIFLPNPVIGCALSHIKCWKTHILNNSTYTLILEDDFFIEKKLIKGIGIKQLIDIYLAHTPNDFDILYLGCISGKFVKNFFKIMGKTNNYKQINDFIAKPEIALAMHSYIISDSGVIKLLNAINNKKISFHIDTYIQSLSSQGILNTYITIPRLVYQSSTYTNTSSLATIVKCPLFNNMYIDKYVSVNYIMNVSLFSFLDFNFSIWILFLILIYVIIILKLKSYVKKRF